MPRRATFTCWRGVVAVDGGIVAWLAHRKRARRKEPPERGSAQGVTSKVDWAGGGVGGRGRPVCLCPLNPTWRFKNLACKLGVLLLNRLRSRGRGPFHDNKGGTLLLRYS